MNRSEFDEKCKEVKPNSTKRATQQEYQLIEYVYQFHPEISETEGKTQIATLYMEFGMGMIRDLLPRAQVMDKLERELRKARAELQRIEEQIREVREGGEI